MRRWIAVSLAAAAALPPLFAAAPEEPVDLAMVTRIREEGFGGSKVMETAERLTDVLGPRLTGSPRMKEANEWARQQLADWGLQGARLEAWGPFGRGWSLERSVVRGRVSYFNYNRGRVETAELVTPDDPRWLACAD